MNSNFVQTFDHHSNYFLNPYPPHRIFNQFHPGINSKRENFKLNLNYSFWPQERLGCCLVITSQSRIKIQSAFLVSYLAVTVKYRLWKMSMSSWRQEQLTVIITTVCAKLIVLKLKTVWNQPESVAVAVGIT